MDALQFSFLRSEVSIVGAMHHATYCAISHLKKMDCVQDCQSMLLSDHRHFNAHSLQMLLTSFLDSGPTPPRRCCTAQRSCPGAAAASPGCPPPSKPWPSSLTPADGTLCMCAMTILLHAPSLLHADTQMLSKAFSDVLGLRTLPGSKSLLVSVNE